MEVHIKRHDMADSHEEADVIVMNQESAARQGHNLIWCLYYYFYHNSHLQCKCHMVPLL